MPSGGGVSMCPGRHFARNEIKALVAVLLQNYERRPIDLAPPGFVEGRAGLGVFAPAGDVPAQIDARR